jgi:steroid delta-isomerase-like uncharacterized protein
MTNQKDTILHHWFEEVWNKGCRDAIDEMLSPDAIAHGLTDANGNEVRGAEAFKSFYDSFREAFPDIQVIVEDTVTEGNRIVARCKVEATHTGAGLGLAPTDSAVEFNGMCMVSVGDGKIVESWNSFDFMTMYQQMGKISLPIK